MANNSNDLSIYLSAVINQNQVTTDVKTKVKKVEQEINKTPIQLRIETNVGVAAQEMTKAAKNYQSVWEKAFLKQRQDAIKTATEIKNTYNSQLFDNFNKSIGIGTTNSNSAKSVASVFDSIFAEEDKYIQLNKLKGEQFFKNFNSSVGIGTTNSNSAKSSASVFENLFKSSEKTTAGMSSLEKQVVKLNPALDEINKKGEKTGQTFSNAAKKMLEWTVVGTAIFGTLNQIKDGIAFISQLDNSLNEIRIVTGQSEESVNTLALAYNKLAKELSVTTSEIAKTSVELYRQGLSADDVNTRLQSIIKYAKISGISLQDSNEIITASVNGTKANVNELIDVFSYLGDATATGADEIGRAFQKTASVASVAGIEYQKLSSYIAVVSSITRNSAETIGNSFKSLLSRYQSIKEKGFNEEDATNINQVTKALKSAGIIAVDSSGQLRNYADVLDELSTKWAGLDKNTKAYLQTALGGTYQADKFAALMENYGDSIKLYEGALNSAGTAQQKFDIYQDSTAAKMDKLKATVEGLYQSFTNSDFLKSIISQFTSFIEVIDRVVTNLGGLQTILLLLTSGVIIKFVSSLYTVAAGAGLVETALVALQLGVKGLSTAMLGLLTNPVSWLLVALTAIPVGIMAWNNEQQKLKQELEETTKAQLEFNSSIKEFNETLDITKINNVTTALENLKKATNYDENVKKLDELEQKLSKLRETNKTITSTREGVTFSYGVNDQKIDETLKQIGELQSKIKGVTTAQNEANKAQELAKSLDYESVQQSSKKIAAKLQEIAANKQLVSSYQSVYNKLQEGKELSADEVALNNKLIQQYPEHVTLLNKKTGAIGVNIKAVQESIKVQEALATIQFNSLKITAETEQQNTENLINSTKARVLAIQSEIDALNARNQAYSAAIDSNDPNAIRYEKQYQINYDKIASAQNLLIEANTRLANLNATNDAWNTIKNMSIDDLLKGDSGSGYVGGGGEKGTGTTKTLTALEAEDSSKLIDILIQSAEKQSKITAEKNKQIESQIKLAKQQKDYNKELELTNKLIEGQNTQISDIESAKAKIKDKENSLSKSSKFKTSTWFNADGGASAEYLSLDESYAKKANDIIKQMNVYENKSSLTKLEKAKYADLKNQLSANNNERKSVEELFSSLDKLKKEYVDLTNTQSSLKDSNDSLTQSNKDLAKSQQEALQKANDEKLKLFEDSVGQIKDLLKKQYDLEEKALNDSLDNYKDYINDLIDQRDRLNDSEDYQESINESNTKINEIQAEIDKRKMAAMQNDMVSINEIADLQKQKTEEEKNLKDKQKDWERKQVKNNLQDQLKYYEDYTDDQKKLLAEKTTDTALQLEAERILAQTNIEIVQNSINELFNKTGENATKAGQLIQSELISKLQQVMDIQNNLPSIKVGSTQGVEDSKSAIKAQMRANSNAYGTASESEKKRLADENLKLGNSINWTRDSHGVWWDENGKLAQYATGGVDDKGGLSILHGTPNAVETIFNADQGRKLYDFVSNLPNSISNILPSFRMPQLTPITSGGSISIGDININGVTKVDNSTLPDLRNSFINELKIQFNRGGTFRK